DQAGVRPNVVRRRVDEDVVEAVHHLLEKYAEARSLKQLHRIGHGRPCPEEVQSFQAVHRHHGALDLTCEQVGQANFSLASQNAVEPGVSQVGVDQECAAGKL